MVKTFALIFGIAYVLAGVMGFIPGLTTPATHGPQLAVEAGHGYLLGLFPVNVLHNIVHLAIGAWGILASRSYSGSRFYGQGLAVFYGLLAIMGLFPVTNTTFGLIPLYSHDVWLHAGSAVVAAYIGFATESTENRAIAS